MKQPVGHNLIVDGELCEGFGVCYSLAPEFFAEGPDGRAVVRDDADFPGGGRLDEIFDQCPRAALRRSDAQ
ncbi:ferredoxin [Mycobacteroides stephanolepidis]|uniref:ferredoxin n=1 Tax=[Mycobacterium] stephanolepidis TaxID=1520670 RepID=UPI001300B7EE